MTTKRKPGKPRPDAIRWRGRPKKADKLKGKTVRLKDEQWAKAETLGEGCSAKGIRRALDEHGERK